jgi:hypothetical protein
MGISPEPCPPCEGGEGGVALALRDEGTPTVAAASILDFVGAGVTLTNSGGGLGTVTIPGGVAPSLFNANTILKADTDDTPEALAVGEQTLVGRITGGEITALTPAQVITLLGIPTAQEGDRINLVPSGSDLEINVVLSNGISGGDTLVGGTDQFDNLSLFSTTHASRGRIHMRDQVSIITEDKNSLAGTAYIAVRVGDGRTITFDETALDSGNSMGCLLFNPTLVYANDSALVGYSVFANQAVIKNNNGAARNVFTGLSFYNAPTFRGDGALLTAVAIGFQDSPTVEIVSGGTTAITLQQYSAGATVSASATISARTGYLFNDATGAGSLGGLQVGFATAALTKGATNIGFQAAKASTAAFDFSGSDGTIPTGIRFFDSSSTIHRSASGVITLTGKLYVTGEIEIDGNLNHDGSNIGFFNVPPVARPSAYTQTFSTADKTHATRTAGALTLAVGSSDGTLQDGTGTYSQTIFNNNFQDVVTAYNALRADLADTAALVNAIIDDLQALGLFQ